MGRRPCCAKVGVNKGAWTDIEDSILTEYINLHGQGKWRDLPKNAGLNRCGKSCRLRWLNYLTPDIKRGNISADEDDLIIRLHKLLGNRWSLIAGRLPGRTDNEIKNHWNTKLAKTVKDRRKKPSTQNPNQSIQNQPTAPAAEAEFPTKTGESLEQLLSSIIDVDIPENFTRDNTMGDIQLSDFLNSEFSDICGFAHSTSTYNDVIDHNSIRTCSSSLSAPPLPLLPPTSDHQDGRLSFSEDWTYEQNVGSKHKALPNFHDIHEDEDWLILH